MTHKTYSVAKISASLTLSGAGDNAFWKKASELSDFSFPWEAEVPQRTTFKALHNDSTIYCLFDVDDDQISVFEGTNDKIDVVSSSRAEIFFKIDDRLTPYYCLEIDPKGRVLDYEGNYYRKFNFGWSWPDNGLVIKSRIRERGYSIEIAITKTSLQKLNLISKKTLQTGLFRADCKLLSNDERAFKWISWVAPDSTTPDFHIPSAFGILQLED
jgi:hypothetical protein